MDKPELKRIKPSWKGIAFLIAATAITLTVIFVKLANPKQIWAVIENYPVKYLLLAMAAICLAWVIDTLRIRIILASTGHRIAFPLLMVIMTANHFVTLVTPFTAGGVPFLIYMLYRYRLNVGQATGIISSASLGAQIGLISVISLILALMKNVPDQIAPYFSYLKLIVLLYGLILAALIYVIWHGHRFRAWFERFSKYPNISQWFNTFVSTYRQTFTKHGRYFIGAALCGSGYFGLLYLAGCFLLTGLQVNPALSFDNYSIATLLGISSSFTPIPGGAGVSEIFSVYMLDDRFSDARLGAFIILWRTIIFYFPIIIGCLAFAYLILVWSKHQQPEQAPGQPQSGSEQQNLPEE